ncbi:MAG: transporter substrate-binding domain-containing protein [Desulfobacterales bacterium]|nr:transporter substrate-binding domain-containing protein [Desulfobacterales bacterium]
MIDSRVFPVCSLRLKPDFTIDCPDLVSGKYGIEFTYHPGTWEEKLHRFKNNEVDVITAISHTEEREVFTRYTTPYGISRTGSDNNGLDYRVHNGFNIIDDFIKSAILKSAFLRDFHR